MSNACTTSPFAVKQETESPWVTWQKSEAVTRLREKQQACFPAVLEEDEQISVAEGDNQPQLSRSPRITRMQYNAVLSRINQAQRRTGSYSAWQV